MKKKGIEEKRRKENYEIRKNFIVRLLVLSFVLLIILIIAYIFVYESEKNKWGTDLGGELGTWKWDLNKEKVVLDILSYNITNNNLTIDVELNWSQGNISTNDFNGELLIFNGIVKGCNLTREDVPMFGQVQVQQAIIGVTVGLNCSESDFSNVTGVFAYAQVNIHLNQTSLIPNLTFYNDDSRNNLIYLNNYFYALTEINYSLVENPNNDKITLTINNTTKNISVSTWDTTWAGNQQFNLTAIENQETLTSSFYINFTNTTRPLINHAPIFNSSLCDDLSWYKNTSYTLNMTKCWRDSDRDNLTLRYENRSNSNLSISQNGVILTLTPNTNWFGTGYFYVYADDGKISEDESARIDFIVRNSNTTNTTPTTPSVVNNDPKIKSSNPASSEIYIFPGNKTFIISAEKYETIKWYLNGTLIYEGGLSYEFSNLNEGDIVKVEVINGTKVDTKVWNIKLAKDDIIEEPLVNAGLVIFYAIIVVICIIIILVIWLFIEEKMKKNIPAGFGFVVTYGSKH